MITQRLANAFALARLHEHFKLRCVLRWFRCATPSAIEIRGSTAQGKMGGMMVGVPH